ncbi:MAG: hypothetical protein ABW003_08680 [Microvirga sp.]
MGLSQARRISEEAALEDIGSTRMLLEETDDCWGRAAWKTVTFVVYDPTSRTLALPRSPSGSSISRVSPVILTSGFVSSSYKGSRGAEVASRHRMRIIIS